MTTNWFKQFQKLNPAPALQVGEAIYVDNGVAQIELPGGFIESARGEATVGQRVYFRDGAIEGPAPNLTVVLIDI